MLTEKELNECLKEDIAHMEDDNIVNEIAYYLYERSANEKGGADIQKPNCVTCGHFGKCEGCEKRDEE